MEPEGVEPGIVGGATWLVAGDDSRGGVWDGQPVGIADSDSVSVGLLHTT